MNFYSIIRTHILKLIVILVLTIFCFVLRIYYMNSLLEEAEQQKIAKLSTNWDITISDLSDNSKKSSINSFYAKKSISDIPKRINPLQTQSNSNQIIPHDEDCIIDIPEIALKKIVYTGKNREKHLNQYELVTATPDMQFQNGGNYIICGHASKLYGHSLNRIKELIEGNKIYIQSQNHKYTYIIDSVQYVNMEQTPKYCKQSSVKELTILSCAKYISKDSYIVIHAKLN